MSPAATCLLPRLSSVGWFFRVTTESFAPSILTATGFRTKNNLGEIGSIIFRLKASSASNGGFVSASVTPSDRTNFLIAAGTKPLRLNALRVGSRGSSQLLTVPLSTSGRIFRFETGMPSNSSLENSIMEGLRSPSRSSMAK